MVLSRTLEKRGELLTGGSVVPRRPLYLSSMLSRGLE